MCVIRKDAEQVQDVPVPEWHVEVVKNSRRCASHGGTPSKVRMSKFLKCCKNSGGEFGAFTNEADESATRVSLGKSVPWFRKCATSVSRFSELSEEHFAV